MSCSTIHNSSVAVSTANERIVSTGKNRDVWLKIINPIIIDAQNLFLGYWQKLCSYCFIEMSWIIGELKQTFFKLEINESWNKHLKLGSGCKNGKNHYFPFWKDWVKFGYHYEKLFNSRLIPTSRCTKDGWCQFVCSLSVFLLSHSNPPSLFTPATMKV